MKRRSERRHLPPPGAIDPSLELKTSVRKQVNTLDIEAFFDRLAQLMKTNPPTANDARIEFAGADKGRSTPSVRAPLGYAVTYAVRVEPRRGEIVGISASFGMFCRVRAGQISITCSLNSNSLPVLAVRLVQPLRLDLAFLAFHPDPRRPVRLGPAPGVGDRDLLVGKEVALRAALARYGPPEDSAPGRR